MIFSSDNWAGACESVADALHAARGGSVPAYGNDALSKEVKETFSELFEKDVAVFFTSTGSVANALALSSCAKPGGHVLCHRYSHIHEDECSGPEFFTGGMKMTGLSGEGGKFSAETLEAAISDINSGGGRFGQPVAVSLTQASELGTVYRPSEIAAVSDVARAHGLPLHMDGARFANALVSLNCSPADMTWKSGVGLLSFGGTKNGCWCAEAVVFFDPDRAADFRFHHMRAGQNMSKARFIAAQFRGYFEDETWLKNARHANRLALKLADGIADIPGCRVAVTPQANEVFPVLPKSAISDLRQEGAVFYEWFEKTLPEEKRPGPDEDVCRLICSFDTADEDVDRFLAILKASRGQDA